MKRKNKECIGCGDKFFTFKDYDYCVSCAVNHNRYLTKSPCSECDGSGIIKFRNQKPRSCKLCHLTKNSMKKTKKISAEEQEENYWEEVDHLAQQKIYHLFTTNIPFQNIKLINEPWKYEERQQKLSGLFLDRDVDYRTLLSDIQEQSSPETSDPEYLAEEIAVWYCRLVFKSLIADLSDYSGYDPAFFADLSED